MLTSVIEKIAAKVKLEMQFEPLKTSPWDSDQFGTEVKTSFLITKFLLVSGLFLSNNLTISGHFKFTLLSYECTSVLLYTRKLKF